MKAIAPGVYENGDGTFWLRVVIEGSRTWRKLTAIRRREAIEEGITLLGAQKRAAQGLCRDPFATQATSVAQLSGEYLTQDCPDKRLCPRPKAFVKQQTEYLRHIVEWFGKMPVDTVRIGHLHEYALWRKSRIFRGEGNRTIDLELQALSNVMNYGVSTQQLEVNYIRNRPRFQTSTNVANSRSKMPRNGDDLNAIASAMFAAPPTEVLGFQFLLEAMTGLRTNEALQLRMDAKDASVPGFADDRWLYVRRSKKGMYPQCRLHDDLRSLIEAHHAWHAEKYGEECVWWFPGRSSDAPLDVTSLAKTLMRICKQLGLPHCTSHGCRAYFVTLQRRAGFRDEEVAQMIGDKSVELIHQTYGDRAVGEEKLSWRRSDGTGAWERWLQSNSSPALSHSVVLPTLQAA